MSNSENGTFPLPLVATSLAPYIRTRQEALRIRRTLTVYLISQITGVKTVNRSYLTLIVPDQAAELPQIATELSGIRKGYLKELQANIVSRKDFHALATQSGGHIVSDPSTNPSSTYTQAVDEFLEPIVHTYLTLLRHRRRYEKLRILQDYMDVLDEKPAAKAGYLDVARIQLQYPLPLPPTNDIIRYTDPSTSGSSDQTTDELVTCLEKAVLRARHNLDKEKKLLADLKERQYSANGRRNGVTPPVSDSRLHVFSRTRDELVNWIEGELAKTESPPNNAQYEGLSSELYHSTKDTKQYMVDIKHTYTKYLEARKMCLTTLAQATSPIPTAVPADYLLRSPKDDVHLGTVHGAVCAVVPYLSAYLLFPSNLHKSIAQQKSHIATILNKEQQATIQALDRLADESHLLPAYPLLAINPRFQNAAAALSSRASPLQVDDRSAGMRTLGLARAWAFAADAAKTSTRDILDEKIAQGTKHACSAEEVLGVVRVLLGQGLQRAGTEKAPTIEDEDIWAASAAPRTKRINRKATSEEKDNSQSIWSGLQGNVKSNSHGI
ncbi:MAG: hypothetical protein M1830_002197 [Pleopsidium flavum]|nr:MAG: hypothetical protein M1830_002197 [Pleopsidium flavum]